MKSINNPLYVKEYEDFLISGKEDSLKTLIPHSISVQYINLLKKISNFESPNELKTEINNFIKDYNFYPFIKLKALYISKYLEKFPERDSNSFQKIPNWYLSLKSKKLK